MKTKQKKYNKINSKKNKFFKNKVKNTNKKLKNKTKKQYKLRKNRNKGGMLRRALFGKTPKQEKLERLFFSALSVFRAPRDYGYVMNFFDSTTNFDLGYTFLDSVPSNNKLAEFINVVSPIPDYGNVPNIIESIKQVLNADGQTRVLGKTNEKLEDIIRIGGREINSINIYYNNKIVYEPELHADVNSYYRKLISLLETIQKTMPTITNLQLFYLISLIPSLDDIVLNFFTSFSVKNSYLLSEKNIEPILLFKCTEAYPGSLNIPPPPNDKTEGYFLKRVVEYRDILNASLCLDPPTTPSILDYILGQNKIKIDSTPETLKVTKSGVCFLYLKYGDTLNEEHRMIGLILNIIEANITTGEINFSNKFRWTVNTKDLSEINKIIQLKGIESELSFLNDVYPLFSSMGKEVAHACGIKIPTMGFNRRPEAISVLTTEGPRESIAPIVHSIEEAS